MVIVDRSLGPTLKDILLEIDLSALKMENDFQNELDDIQDTDPCDRPSSEPANRNALYIVDFASVYSKADCF